MALQPSQPALCLGPSACEHKVALSKSLTAAAEQLALATQLLEARIGVALKDEYSVLRRKVEDAHVATDDAKHALIAHIAKHGC